MEPLAGSKKITETEKAVLIEWTLMGKYVEDEQQVQHWFPKSRITQNSYGVWIVEDWLYHKVDNELRPQYLK